MSTLLAPLHLALAIEPARAPHAAALLHSIVAHVGKRPLHLHLLRETSFEASALARLASYIESLGIRFHDHPVEAARVGAMPRHDYFPQVDWLRLLAPELIDADRVLFLEAELIARSDLGVLADLSFDGHLLAAVHEGMWFNSTRYGVHTHLASIGLSGADYFNTALLLMDLAAMRREGIAGSLVAYAVDERKTKRLSVQDALNVVLHGRWKRLPMKWSVHKIVTMNHRLELPLPDRERDEARFQPAVVQFCGPDKPWFPNSRHPFRPEYIRHRNHTPWSDGLYRQMDAQTYAYFRLPLAMRVYLYGWLPADPSAARRYRHLLSPRYVGGAVLQKLPAKVSGPIRDAARRLGLR